MLETTTDDHPREDGHVASAGPDHPVLTDSDTDLPNRLHFDVVYRVVFAAGTRGFPIALLLIEAPALEESLDQICELGGRLAAVTRRMDLLARLDGGRFVALLLGCNVHGGRVAAERIVLALEPWLQAESAELKIGVAALQAHMEREGELMEEARIALLEALSLPGNAIETRP